MGAVGEDTNLIASVGHRRYAALDKRHRQQGNGHLLTGGNHHIQFSGDRLITDLLGEIDQAVGFATHCRDDHDDIVSTVAELLDLLGHLLDPLDSADRGASKLLYDQSHC